MLPADDDQRRREMAAAVSQSPAPSTPPSPKPTKTRKLNHPINLVSTDLILHNEDLLKEILLRLPVKYVIRFKSVCKKWLSLISSDYFCHQHTLRRPQKPQPSLILEHLGLWPDRSYFYWKPTSINGGEKVMIPYSLGLSLSHSLYNDYKILQVCNGLWLLNTGSDSTYIVYNPTTKLSREITPTYHDEDHHVETMSLAFDPSKSPYYKVVCVISPKPDVHNYLVEVYESESHSWKLSLGPFTIPSGFDVAEAKYCNNAIYWLCHDGDYTYCCFDIAKHEMKELPFPESDDLLVHRSYLQELNGRLYNVILDYDEFESYQLFAEVWELGGDGNSEWLLKHHDNLITCEGIGKCVKLMQGHSYGSLQLIYDCHLSGKMKMRAYNFLDKSFEDLVDFTVPSCNDYVKHLTSHRFGFLLKAFQFWETLALV